MELDPQSYFEEKTEETNDDDSGSDIEIIDEIQNAPQKLCDISETPSSDTGFISGEEIAQKNVPPKSQAVKKFLEDLANSK